MRNKQTKLDDDFHNETNRCSQVNDKRTEFKEYQWRNMFRKDRMQMFIPIFTVMVFLGFALLIGLVIVLSIIPIYLENISVEKTRFILTSKIEFV